MREQFKDGAPLHRGIYSKVMTMGKKEILARVIGILKEKCG